MYRSWTKLPLARVLLAALQLTLWVAAPYADALLEAEASTAYVHIEAHTDKSCPRPHPADCPICQFAHSRADTPQETAFPAVSTATLEAPSWTAEAPPSAHQPSSPLPRGPPLLA